MKVPPVDLRASLQPTRAAGSVRAILPRQPAAAAR